MNGDNTLPNIKSDDERLRVGERSSRMHWKAAIERGQSDASINSVEREQARPLAKVRLIEQELMKRMFEGE